MNPDHVVAILMAAASLACLFAWALCRTAARADFDSHVTQAIALCDWYAAAANAEGRAVVDAFDEVVDEDAAVAQIGVDVEIYNRTGAGL